MKPYLFEGEQHRLKSDYCTDQRIVNDMLQLSTWLGQFSGPLKRVDKKFSSREEDNMNVWSKSRRKKEDDTIGVIESRKQNVDQLKKCKRLYFEKNTRDCETGPISIRSV